MELPKNIKDEIWEYCRLNDISGIDDFIVKMIKQGFTSEKFGSTPWNKEPEVKEIEKVVTKEVKVEVVKEVPVEVIKEVYITDDEKTNELSDELNKTKEELKKITEDNLDIANKLTILETENKTLKEQLELEKSKPKIEEQKDIYGDEKKGFFGSNLSDLWKRKK